MTGISEENRTLNWNKSSLIEVGNDDFKALSNKPHLQHGITMTTVVMPVATVYNSSFFTRVYFLPQHTHTHTHTYTHTQLNKSKNDLDLH